MWFTHTHTYTTIYHPKKHTDVVITSELSCSPSKARISLTTLFTDRVIISSDGTTPRRLRMEDALAFVAVDGLSDNSVT
jgi:hypothetical protein